MPELRDLKVSEYDLATLEGIVCDITKAIKNKKSDYLGIGIAVVDCEVADMVTALLSTGLFEPDYLDYTDNNYRGEYYILSIVTVVYCLQKLGAKRDVNIFLLITP